MGNHSLDLKCPYRTTLITRSFTCPHASEITRRDGPDIACNQATSHQLCEEFYNRLKVQVLPAMGHTEDLTQLPASVLQKIQFGGLLGLNKQVRADTTGSVKDIAGLLSQAHDQYGNLAEFPYAECIESVEAYQIRRRRTR